MDLYNENRTMIHMDAVARKDKEATISVWGDYTAVLLDHYCTFSSSPQNLLYSESFLVLLTKEEKSHGTMLSLELAISMS